MAWTNIANANLDVGAPIRSVDLLALRDNITALANGDTGAPPIKAPALGSGQTGNAPIFAPRAWVNFDGANAFAPNPSTSAIYGSGNVSSVTKNSTGDFTINFAIAMPDANYCVSGVNSSVAGDGQGDGGGVQIRGLGYTQQASSVRIVNYAARSAANVSPKYVNVIVMR